MPNKYDVIIIGAGLGGLSAGACLSKNGKKILVLEKGDKLGGYAVNFKRGDFLFDAVLHMINGGADINQPTYRVLNKCGIVENIELLKHKYLYRSIYPDFDFRVEQRNLGLYYNFLCELFPKEKDGIMKLFNSMKTIFHNTDKFLQLEISNLTTKLINHPILVIKMFRYCNLTVQRLLDKFLKNNKLKAIICQLWPFYGLPPSKLPAFYFSYPWFDYHYNGGYYPKGGGQSIPDALAEVIKGNDGEIKLKSEVIKIIIKNKKSIGVQLKNDEEFFADKIISNISARKTFLSLLGETALRKNLLEKIKNMEPSISAFIVYLGLNVDLSKQGITDYEVFVNPNYDLDKQYIAAINNNLDNTVLILTFYSNIDKTSVRQGKFLMSIATLSGYEFWGKLSPDEYTYKKNFYGDILIKKIEKIIPNLLSYIEVKEIATPLTMERYTDNYKGAIYGWNQIISQSGIRRMNYSTPIQNLFMASAWTLPGGGFFCAMHAGEIVAQKILS